MYEPDIFQTTRRFGTILENVDLDPRTRAARPRLRPVHREHPGRLPARVHRQRRPDRAWPASRSNVVLLTADAFGVLPPISRLTHDQAAYHFISGYTAKLAGTEIGVKEPKATFSACFGAPFMPRHPGEYARDAHRSARALRRPGLAREHRLDGRAVRDRRADEHQPHPGDGPGGARRQARRRRDRSTTRSSGSRSRPAAPTCRPSSSSRARRGRTPTPTTAQAAALARMFARQLRELSRPRGDWRQEAGPGSTDRRRGRGHSNSTVTRTASISWSMSAADPAGRSAITRTGWPSTSRTVNATCSPGSR